MALLVPRKPTLRDLFRFLLALPPSRKAAVLMLSFFPFFLLQAIIRAKKQNKKIQLFT